MTATALYTLQIVILGTTVLGVSAGVLGAFAVLRRQSLLGDVLSHAMLPGICLGFLAVGGRSFPVIVFVALVVSLLAALSVLVLMRNRRIREDAAQVTTLSVFFAAGIVLLTFMQRQDNVYMSGIDSFLFGQAAAILADDLWVMTAVAVVAVVAVAAAWKELKLTAFDRDHAVVIGVPVFLFDLMLVVLIALVIIIGLQMVGVVLMSAMLVAPAVAARQWTKSVGGMVVLSAVIGIFSGVGGGVISVFAEDAAIGPIIVLFAGGVVFFSLLFAPQRGILRALLARHSAARLLRQQQVLLDFLQLARKHDNPHYPVERGMIAALYNADDVERLLRPLIKSGNLRFVHHMPAVEGAHWQFTDKGYQQALVFAGLPGIGVAGNK